MSKRRDRECMYNMANDDGYLSTTYSTKVDSFLDYAFSNEEYVDKDCIKCPCAKCYKVSPIKVWVHPGLYNLVETW